MRSSQVTGERLGRSCMVPAVRPLLPPPCPCPGPVPCPPPREGGGASRPHGASGPGTGSAPRDRGSPGLGVSVPAPLGPVQHKRSRERQRPELLVRPLEGQGAAPVPQLRGCLCRRTFPCASSPWRALYLLFRVQEGSGWRRQTCCSLLSGRSSEGCNRVAA